MPEAMVREIDYYPDLPRLFSAIARGGHGFWLDSSMTHESLGRYSILGSRPFLILRSRGREVVLTRPEGETRLHANPFDVLADLMASHSLNKPPEVPFAGGAVGYFAYDLGRQLEALPATATDDLGVPEMYLAFYDSAVVIDHYRRKTFLCQAPVSGAGEAVSGLENDITGTENAIAGAGGSAGRPGGSNAAWLAEIIANEGGASPRPTPPSAAQAITSNFDQVSYCRAVEMAKEHILAGDIYQVNLSQRFTAPLATPPFEFYLNLRQSSPAPFSAFLDFDGLAVASSSPERFLKITGDLVETRPIKGTRPRGRTPAEDEALKTELLASSKDRAELVMIVDLERNDLGRVCRFGTVRVPKLYALESYAAVHHLVSTVTGRLRPEAGPVDCLKACFPGGSITGAPKIRAMEIIEELEPVRRGVYTGAIGYLDFSGAVDLNIAIRTAVIRDGQVHYHAGGGIVADSEPLAEYHETLHKARGFFRALSLETPLQTPLTDIEEEGGRK